MNWWLVFGLLAGWFLLVFLALCWYGMRVAQEFDVDDMSMSASEELDALDELFKK